MSQMTEYPHDRQPDGPPVSKPHDAAQAAGLSIRFGDRFVVPTGRDVSAAIRTKWYSQSHADLQRWDNTLRQLLRAGFALLLCIVGVTQ